VRANNPASRLRCRLGRSLSLPGSRKAREGEPPGEPVALPARTEPRPPRITEGPGGRASRRAGCAAGSDGASPSQDHESSFSGESEGWVLAHASRTTESWYLSSRPTAPRRHPHGYPAPGGRTSDPRGD